MQQLPSRSLVDVLLYRNQLRNAAPQFEEGVGIVTPVTGEAVNLVEDHVVNVALSTDACEHALKLGPVGGLGPLSAVEVLLDDLRAEILSLPVAGLPLGRQRVALSIGVLIGLLGSRHPEVNNGLLDYQGRTFVSGSWQHFLWIMNWLRHWASGLLD